MYTFVFEQEEKTAETVENLIDSLIEMEDMGSMSDEDVDECIYYLQKISEISGLNIDFNELNDKHQRI
jgi:hypothetical protein